MTSTPFDRQTSFAFFSAQNPLVPHSGADLDAEFNAVKTAMDDTQQNLALIQDDDGVLKRGSVGQAQLDASISIGFGAPTGWTASTTYDADVSTVFYASKFYICIEDHTSTASFEADKWEEIADFTLAAVIDDGSITSAKLATGAVTADKIGAGSISSAKMASGAVTTAKIANEAITIAKIDTAIGPDLAEMLIPAGLGPLPWSMPTLPTGWDWADGDVLLADTLFPVLRAAYIAASFPYGQDGSGNPYKPDARNRTIIGKGDMGPTAAATRISVTHFGGGDPNGLGATGGDDGTELLQANLPNVTFAVTITDPGHSHTMPLRDTFAAAAGGNQVTQDFTGGITAGGDNVGTSVTGITATAASGGSGTEISRIQPSIVCNMIIKAH